MHASQVACAQQRCGLRRTGITCFSRLSFGLLEAVGLGLGQMAFSPQPYLLSAACSMSPQYVVWMQNTLRPCRSVFFLLLLCVLMPIWSKIANTATTVTTTTAKIMFYNDSMYFCFSQALSFAVLTPWWCFASRTTCYQNHTWNIFLHSLPQQSLYEPACIVFNVFLFLFHFKALKKNSNYAYYLRHGRASSLVPVCLCHIHEVWAALTQTCQSAKCPKKKRKEIKFSSYTSQRRLCLTQVLNAFWTHSINMK